MRVKNTFDFASTQVRNATGPLENGFWQQTFAPDEHIYGYKIMILNIFILYVILWQSSSKTRAFVITSNKFQVVSRRRYPAAVPILSRTYYIYIMRFNFYFRLHIILLLQLLRGCPHDRPVAYPRGGEG